MRCARVIVVCWARSLTLSVLSLFPFLVPKGAVGRGGVIVTPAAVSLVSRCHNRTEQAIYGRIMALGGKDVLLLRGRQHRRGGGWSLGAPRNGDGQ
jgi:hypothetical protein